jgi:hypothetical protein
MNFAASAASCRVAALDTARHGRPLILNFWSFSVSGLKRHMPVPVGSVPKGIRSLVVECPHPVPVPRASAVAPGRFSAPLRTVPMIVQPVMTNSRRVFATLVLVGTALTVAPMAQAADPVPGDSCGTSDQLSHLLHPYDGPVGQNNGWLAKTGEGLID